MLINPSYFNEVGRKGVPKMSPYSAEYRLWWKEQKGRCMDGYSVGGKFMPGRLYFYVNFWNIELSDQSTGRKKMGIAWLRDVEWEMADNLERCRKEHKGMILLGGRGSGKCLAPGTAVLMYSGELKNVEDIKTGDLVMGINSQAKRVTAVHCGIDEMYEIVQNRGMSYTVNSQHLVSLKSNSGTCNKKKLVSGKTALHYRYGRYPGEILDIKASDLAGKSKKFFQVFSGWRGNGVDFAEKPVYIDPYFLGLWLGDGNSHNIGITSIDYEIVKEVYNQAEAHGLKVTINQNKFKDCPTYNITAGNGSYGTVHKSALLNKFRCADLIKNKHIPKLWLINSRSVRLELLAGLIDTDGHYRNGYYEITQKSERLAKDIQFLCRTLGFYCSLKKVTKSIKSIGFSGQYYRLGICGNIDKIPVRLKRKKATCKKNKNPFITRINAVKPKGKGVYYGFTLEKDPYFFLEDLTVVHNSFSLAGLGVGYEYTFFRNNEIVVSAYETKYSVKHLQKVKLGLDNISGAVEYAGEYFPSPFSHNRLKDDWTREVISGYQEKVGNSFVTKGFNSRILHRVYADNHMAANGTRPSFHIMEEIGCWPNLITSYNSSAECWMDGAVQFGIPVLLGTGGDMESGTIDARKMFYDPDTYNLISFDDIYENKGKIGYFIPGIKGLNQFKDSNGNTKEAEARQYLEERRERKRKGTDKRAFYQELQYQPFIPSEAFLISKGNVFPAPELQEHLSSIETDSAARDLGQTGRLIWKDDGTLKWEHDQNLVVADFPVIEGQKKGCIVIWEHPKDNPPYGLYIAGCDPYAQEDAETTSLGSIFIYKGIHHAGDTYNWPVAEYTGRPNTLEEYYENCRKLLIYYNASCLYENMVRGMKEHMEHKNSLYLLHPQPHIIKDIVPDSRVDRGYGIHMSVPIRDFCELKLRDWLLAEFEPGKLNLSRIYSVPLLKELIAYNDTGNFDRVDAFMLCILLEQEHHKLKVVETLENSYIDPFWNRPLFNRSHKVR